MLLFHLATEFGLKPKRVASTNGDEYSSACPICGGTDRFRIWPNQQAQNCTGTYWCRKCEISGNAINFAREFLGFSYQDAITRVGGIAQHDYCRLGVEKSFISPTLIPPSEQWSNRASDFVSWANKQIKNFSEPLSLLTKRGLDSYAIDRFLLGYCDRDLFVEGTEFGVEKRLVLPQGIVIPSLEQSGKIVRLKIRRISWFPQDERPKYWAIKGSMNGLNIVGDVRKPLTIVVESELDALALVHTCGDLAFAIAVGSNTKNPDNVSDYWVKRRQLFICHDNDDGGLVMNTKWKKLYSHAISAPVPLEFGKDLGEAIAKGLDLRAWLKTIIREGTNEKSNSQTESTI